MGSDNLFGSPLLRFAYFRGRATGRLVVDTRGVAGKIGGFLVLARTLRCVEVEPEAPLVEGRMSGSFEVVKGGAPLIVASTILCVGGKAEDSFVVFGII